MPPPGELNHSARRLDGKTGIYFGHDLLGGIPVSGVIDDRLGENSGPPYQRTHPTSRRACFQRPRIDTPSVEFRASRIGAYVHGLVVILLILPAYYPAASRGELFGRPARLDEGAPGAGWRISGSQQPAQQIVLEECIEAVRLAEQRRDRVDVLFTCADPHLAVPTGAKPVRAARCGCDRGRRGRRRP